MVENYQDSWTWCYGTLSITFPDPRCDAIPGIALDYSGALTPIGSFGPIVGLPENSFTLGELIEMIQRNDVSFTDPSPAPPSDVMLLSEGLIGVTTVGTDPAPDAHVLFMAPVGRRE